jgi:hypothetical protein
VDREKGLFYDRILLPPNDYDNDQYREVDQRVGVAATLDRWWERDGPLPGRIAAALAHAVESGQLAAMPRLPSERALARTLGVSRGRVVAAYTDLDARGLVERR